MRITRIYELIIKFVSSTLHRDKPWPGPRHVGFLSFKSIITMS